MFDETSNNDVANPLDWLKVVFTPDMVEDVGYSVQVETVNDDAGITYMRVVINRLED